MKEPLHVQEKAETHQVVHKKRKRSGLWFLLLIVGIGIGAVAWQQLASRSAAAVRADQVEKPASAPTDVILVTADQLNQIATDVVKERQVKVDRKATGKVAFNEDRMTPVFTPYSGRVVELLANKGENVKAGDPLVVLESPDFVAAQNDLVSARSDVAKAKIGVDAAKVAADRARDLHAHEALATKDLQQAEADLARAQDEVRRADAALAAVESRLALFGKNPQEIANLGQRVDQLVTLRAPISGTIVDRKIGPGQFVKPDAPDPLFLISDLTTLWVLADVYESDVALIHQNMPVEVTVEAFADRTFPARISFISPTVDPSTRTLRVRCLVSNPNGLLRPDMFATVKMGAAGQESALIVPAAAVVVDGADSLVFTAEGPGQFRRRRIQVGPEVEGGGFVVQSGLRPGEGIATKGALLLSELSKSK
jgi:cobalt-zinc-cadmium efflux system membrane fusion protein